MCVDDEEIEHVKREFGETGEGRQASGYTIPNCNYFKQIDVYLRKVRKVRPEK